jgi:hypothetical protein
MRWYWPKLTGLKEAEEAAHAGAGVCFVIAVFTAVAAGMSFWLDRPVLGIHAGAFADAILFGIAGWRIWRLSRIWAVLALVIFVMETVYAVEVTSGPIPPSGAFIRAVFTLVLIGSVRGTFIYYAFKKKESAVSSGAAGGGSQ